MDFQAAKLRKVWVSGVPFFLYQTNQGARFAFSELPADILAVAQADIASP